MTYICVSKLIIIGSDNGLLPGRRQCWNTVDWTRGNKLQWNLNRNVYIFIHEMHFKMSPGKWRPFFSRSHALAAYIGYMWYIHSRCSSQMTYFRTHLLSDICLLGDNHSCYLFQVKSEYIWRYVLIRPINQITTNARSSHSPKSMVSMPNWLYNLTLPCAPNLLYNITLIYLSLFIIADTVDVQWYSETCL